MKRFTSSLAIFALAIASAACGTADQSDPNLNLRITPPAMSVDGETVRVEMQNPDSGEYVLVEEFRNIKVASNEFTPVRIVLNEQNSEATSFSAIFDLDNHVIAQPIELKTTVSAGTTFKLQIHVWTDKSKQFLPESFESVYRAKELATTELSLTSPPDTGTN